MYEPNLMARIRGFRQALPAPTQTAITRRHAVTRALVNGASVRLPAARVEAILRHAALKDSGTWVEQIPACAGCPKHWIDRLDTPIRGSSRTRHWHRVV